MSYIEYKYYGHNIYSLFIYKLVRYLNYDIILEGTQ